jgi:hypothetical protein
MVEIPAKAQAGSTTIRFGIAPGRSVLASVLRFSIGINTSPDDGPEPAVLSPRHEKELSMRGRTCPSLWLLALLAASPAAVAAPAPPRKVAIAKETDHLDFRGDRQASTVYHFGPRLAKPYFWPVLAPNGLPLTRPWPMGPRDSGGSLDHPHQKSLWFCHGDVIPEGMTLTRRVQGVRGVDFWSETPGHGRIVCTHVGNPEKTRSGIAILTRNDWRTADDVTILTETRRIELLDLGSAQLYVLTFDLHASVVPITFGDTKEGSLGARVRDSMTEKPGQGRLTNADGKVGEKECWGRISDWCDYSGPSDDSVVGITLFADPANPYPSCWHARSYGLMAANPFGREASGFPAMKGKKDLVRLKKGEHLKLRYGVLLHTGDAQQGKVAEHYRLFKRIKEG